MSALGRFYLVCFCRRPYGVLLKTATLQQKIINRSVILKISDFCAFHKNKYSRIWVPTPLQPKKPQQILESHTYKLIQANKGTPIPSLSNPRAPIRSGISSISGHTQGMDTLFIRFHFKYLMAILS